MRAGNKQACRMQLIKILALLPLGSLALNRPAGPVIQYQLYDLKGNPIEGKIIEEDVELKRRQASKDFRNYLNGTSTASFPFLSDDESTRLFRVMEEGVRALLTAVVNSEFAKVRRNPRDAAAIARLVAKYYEADPQPINDTFRQMDQILSDDEETKLNTRAIVRFLDGALNSDFMELSLDIMHGIANVSPGVARLSLDNIKKLQAKHALVPPATFDKFLVRMGKY